MTDRLDIVRALENTGMEAAKADAVATAVVETINASVATKADLQLLQVEIRKSAAFTDAHIERKVDALTLNMEAEFKALRTALATGLRDVSQRTIIQLGSMIVVIAGIITSIIITAMRYLLPSTHT
jgi:hypothetical protein